MLMMRHKGAKILRTTFFTTARGAETHRTATPLPAGSRAARIQSAGLSCAPRRTDCSFIRLYLNIVHPLQKRVPRSRRPGEGGEDQSGSRHTCQLNTKWTMPRHYNFATRLPRQRSLDCKTYLSVTYCQFNTKWAMPRHYNFAT